jgi:hypothetical protein
MAGDTSDFATTAIGTATAATAASMIPKRIDPLLCGNRYALI